MVFFISFLVLVGVGLVFALWSLGHRCDFCGSFDWNIPTKSNYCNKCLQRYEKHMERFKKWMEVKNDTSTL